MARPSLAAHPNVLHVATEAVLQRDSAGRIWLANSATAGEWSVHLGAFETLRFVARVGIATTPRSDPDFLDPARLGVVPLPVYKGLAAFLRVSVSLCRILWTQSGAGGVALLQLPGPIGAVFGLCLTLRGRPYAVQLVGDVDEVLANGKFSFPTRLTRRPLTWITRYLCKSARVVAYVTRQTLQRKYPCSNDAAAFAFSNVQLDRAVFAPHPHRSRSRAPLRVVFCGSLAQLYKGLDVLIEAVRLLTDRGVQVSVAVIGDGGFRPRLEQMATTLGVQDRFTFVGEVRRPQVLAMLEEADLFVMPSRTEGLPRALLEAMAKGLPCVASRVGGIPELLSDEALVTPGDAPALAAAIARFAETPALMEAEAQRNLAIARQFDSSLLAPERARFVNALQQMSGRP